MAITKIHAVKVRLGDAINYIENPDKTDGQELISGYNTAPQTAVLDFSVTAAMARKARNTSAKKQGNLAYHMIQSFSPDDAVTPELAHKLGRKLAMEFTDGKFEFVVATHINKDSIHMVTSDNITLFIHTQATVSIAVIGKTDVQPLFHHELLQALNVSGASIVVDVQTVGLVVDDVGVGTQRVKNALGDGPTGTVGAV